MALLLIIGFSGKTGLPESESPSGGSHGPAAPAAPAAPAGEKGQVKSRLWQTDHWFIVLEDGTEVHLPKGADCAIGESYRNCK